MKENPFVILGAGGHGRVVAETLRTSGREVAAFLDADPALHGTTVETILVAGGDEAISEFPVDRFSYAVGIGGAKDTVRRREIHESAVARGAALPPVIAASAVVARSARLDDGAQVLARAVVNPGASIGAGTVINTSAVVEHDCVLGAHVFIGPGAILCGGVKIGDGTFVGAGAVILPEVRLGSNVLVGAGAVVRADVPDGAACWGIPARKMR